MKTLEKIINSIKNIARPFAFAGALALSSLAGCINDGDEIIPDPPPAYTWEETQKNPLMHEGVVLTSWWYDDYLRPQSDFTLEYLHGLGAESVSILATQYQDSSSPAAIYYDLWKTPMDSGIEHVIQKSKSLGMRTVLKPHVDPTDGTWRGNITFSSEAEWASWFNSYKNFILHYAQLAEDNGVDMLVIGTELAGTTHREADWSQLIDDIKAVFSGEITYAADNDNYQNITWWNRLDYIGVNAYFPLTASSDPTLSELISEWSLIAQELQAFSQAQGKKIIITEIGYQSYDGANMMPWWAPTSIPDEQEQADCYEAFLSNLFNQGFIAGIYPWMCYHNPWQDVDGFDFAAKPAEDNLGNYYHLMD
jgi:hypothetical protein